MLSTLRELRFYVKNLLVLRFNERVSSLDAEQFLEQIIWQRIRPQELVVGYDFRFGYKGQGDVLFLAKWVKTHNIKLRVIEPVLHQHVLVKSSTIRECLQEENFELARNFLGHSYLIIGKVVRGDQVGRTMGFPTANLQVPDLKTLPPNGVYQGKVLLQKEFKKCLIYLGKRPTFRGLEQRLEVHILNYNGEDLYQKQIKVFVEHKIRGEMTFANKEALMYQIQKDVAQVA